MSHDMNHEVMTAKRLARITGALYLIIAVFGMFAGTVSTNLAVDGDPAGTADNVLASLGLVRAGLAAWIIVLFADLAVTITRFALLKPVSPTLSLLAAAFRVVYAAIQGINLLNLFNAVLLLTNSKFGLVFFGMHLIALGYLLFTSRYVPRAISILVVAAGIGYTADSLGYLFVADFSGVATAVLLAPAAAGELALTLWLVVKGVQVRRPGAIQQPEHSQPQSRRVIAAA